MIDTFKSWVLQIAGIAMIAAAITTLTPESRTKKAVSLVCGIALIISMLSLKLDFDYDSYSKSMAQYKNEIELYASDVEKVNKNLTRTIIEENSAAYILDKGEEMGIGTLEASVTAKWDSESSVWYPVSVSIVSDANADQARSLTYYIETYLGIAKEKQIWSTYDEN